MDAQLDADILYEEKRVKEALGPQAHMNGFLLGRWPYNTSSDKTIYIISHNYEI